ncbi:uncharacterized protein BBOV_IV004980 [Babesia bovis T2Bo]|uniref:uncharacterized protein n=1 Tax=Babesia bovis T2Bo TaxID=484906 RepID=UPI001E011D74|nr:uncharacterized protein BBOV_IV004980 [Babesia bovis T2Bo]EDO06859.2 hypothetical protein BBOV_IV004980 [Babesia bovis T2Bo]
MANVQLDGICRNLRSTLEDTDALYKSIQMGMTKAPVQKKPVPRSRLTKSWIPPMTEPCQSEVVAPAHKSVHFPRVTKDVQQKTDYMTMAAKSDFFRSLNVDLDGWSESQRKVFYNVVSAAERHMHAESERLQREYSLQLESKLQNIRSEMSQAHSSVVAEVSELRVDKERLAFDEVENRRRSKLMQDSLQRLQKSYDSLMEECNAKSSEIIRLNSTLGATERSFINFKQRVIELEGDLNERVQQIDRLHDEVATAYKQMETASSNYAKCERNLASTKTELKSTQDQLSDARLEIESMQLAAQLANNEKCALESKLRALEKEISELSAERYKLETHVSTLENGTIISLKEQCKRLEEQRNLARVETATCDKRQELAQTRRELESVQYQCEQLSEDNRVLRRENTGLSRQLDDLKQRFKDCENELFQLKCQAHVMKQRGYVPVKQTDCTIDAPGSPATKEPLPTENTKPAYRDIFAPTMFDCPDAETQAKIDSLESELTSLYIEKDRMVSEMTRCKVEPKSPALERRRFHLLEQELADTNQRIHEITESIRKLQVPI